MHMDLMCLTPKLIPGLDGKSSTNREWLLTWQSHSVVLLDKALLYLDYIIRQLINSKRGSLGIMLR